MLQLCLYIIGYFITSVNTAHHSPGYQMMLSKISMDSNSKGNYIKMSGSKLWPRKVEIVSVHKNETTTLNILHITTELVNTPTALIYSLINGLYKITTESIKLVLDVEQYGISSD